MRELSRCIQAGDLSPDDKLLLSAFAWQTDAWKSGLVDNLFAGAKRIAWQGKFRLSAGETRCVFLFDLFVRPTAGPAFPLTCVVTDEAHRIIYWDSVASWSVGFAAANIKQDDTVAILTVVTHCNWFWGKGYYKYRLKSDGIEIVGKETFSQYDDGEVDTRPPLLKYPEELREFRREFLGGNEI